MKSKKPQIAQTTLFCGLFVGVMVGVGVAKTLHLHISETYIPIVFLFCLLFYRINKKFLVLVSFTLGMLVGQARGVSYLQKINTYNDLKGQKVTLQVTADSAAVYAKNAQLEFDATKVVVISPYYIKLPGRIVVSGYGVNSILRGDTLTVTGKLYSRRGSKLAGVNYAELTVTSRSASYIENVRRNFMAGLATALPEPHDQFAAGLLVGQRSDLSQSVTETLRTVGLSHVIAVSGYNLTIMVELARKRFGKKSQYRKLLFSISFVLLFLAIAGSSASIARAAYVSVLTIVASHYGRNFKPHVLLLLVAALTAYLNPLNLWIDLGWYLSFLSFYGVLLVAPAVTKRLYKLKEPKLLAKLLIETISAQAATLPLILYIFHDLSVISIIANLAVVPFVPLAMLLSFIAGIAGMSLPMWALAIGMPARLLLEGMLSVSNVLSRIPNAMVHVSIGLATMLFLYAILLSTTLIMNKATYKNGILHKELS